MRRVYLWLVTMLLALLLSTAAVADDEMPSVAILRFGPLPNINFMEGAILDVLESYGWISALENRFLEERRDHAGENIAISWGDAAFDYPSASLMLEAALDKEPDVIIALGAVVAQNAVNATIDMETPIPVLFGGVNAPYDIGIAAAPCIKPDHVTGVSPNIDFEYVIATLLRHDPDVESIGVIVSPSETSSVTGLARIEAAAEAQGIAVDAAAATALADLRPAVNSLVDAGVEAIVVPGSALTTSGLPIITEVANEVGLPVFHPSFSAIYFGATIGAGVSPHYRQGVDIGRILVAHLNGEIDIARVAISAIGLKAIGVNLDSAFAQGVEVSDELLADAAAVIKDGRPSKLAPVVLAAIARRGVIVRFEDRIDDDRAMLASLHCTDEMIAEQQAELDAAE